MNNELSTKIYCLKMNDGNLVYLDEKQYSSLKEILEADTKAFIDIEGEIINTKYIMGLYRTETVEAEIRRKNGQWKCGHGYWHNKGEECGHNIFRG
jgi:hypothetical protein